MNATIWINLIPISELHKLQTYFTLFYNTFYRFIANLHKFIYFGYNDYCNAHYLINMIEEIKTVK